MGEIADAVGRTAFPMNASSFLIAKLEPDVTVTPPFSSIAELTDRRDVDRECCRADEIGVVVGGAQPVDDVCSGLPPPGPWRGRRG